MKNNLKKLTVGAGVLVVFFIYSFVVRNQENPVILTPEEASGSSTSAKNQTYPNRHPASDLPPQTPSNTISAPVSMNTKNTAPSPKNNTGNRKNSSPISSSPSTGKYKDGTYTGSSVNAYYGDVQVAAVISGGKMTDIKILDFPNTHETSVIINHQALPSLKQEAIQNQNADVHVISGATFTSEAFRNSLASALLQAQNT
ncbi:MAG TPA: FMN-binding protein [Candidatus Paceibacterota bacterium]|nr:FMN-binding protein [Candidatus Paceibacterota bacterium]